LTFPSFPVFGALSDCGRLLTLEKSAESAARFGHWLQTVAAEPLMPGIRLRAMRGAAPRTHAIS
jgi:hypothetical protein